MQEELIAERVPLTIAAASEPVDAAIPSAAIPWYIWYAVASLACSVVGNLWDISWHESIGRDSFWTPPHLVIYLGGALAGVSSGYLILATTFGRIPALRDASVSIWGFRGPLGAFLSAWGGIAMLTSGPFDNWWHGAYGLDVRILSPPHFVLALGVCGVRVGTLFLLVAFMNRADGKLRKKLEAFLYYALVFLLQLTMGVMLEATLRNFMHSARFYLAVALTAPLWIGVTARVMRERWACTIVVGVYTVWRLLLVWLLPLIPAEPKLGPVYFSVTHLIPPDFPVLIIVPAVACDLVRRRLAGRSFWTQAAVLGPVFLATLLAVQWPFADFLMSPASRNAFFGTHYFPYFLPPTTDWARNVYSHVEPTAARFWWRMALACALSIATMRAGLAWGEWMRRVRR